jgi:thiol:disulfide interchange protein DsbD
MEALTARVVPAVQGVFMVLDLGGGRDVLQDKALVVGAFMMFGAGAASAATPCIYPLIPVVVGFFGAQGKGRRLIGLSLLFMFGVAVMFSVLGTVSALTGRMLGFQLQKPAVLWTVGGVLALAGGLTLAGTTLRLPAKVSEVVKARAGYGGAFIMGATLGVVALGCVGPFLVGLLAYVAGKGSAVSGTVLFLAFGLGVALPVVIIGNISRFLVNVPRGGAWNEWVKKLMGVLLLLMGVYFVRPILPEGMMLKLMGIVLMAGGVVSGFVGGWAAGTRTETVRKLAGAAMLLAGVGIVLVTPQEGMAAPELRHEKVEAAWAEGRTVGKGEGTQGPVEVEMTEEATRPAAEPTPSVSVPPAEKTEVSLLEHAKNPLAWPAFDWDEAKEAARDHPVMVVLRADWCPACWILEEKTLQDERVIEKLKGFEVFLADITTDKRSPALELAVAARIPGTPTMLFYVHDGRIIGDLIVSTYLPAEDMLRLLEVAEEVYYRVKKMANEGGGEKESE